MQQCWLEPWDQWSKLGEAIGLSTLQLSLLLYGVLCFLMLMLGSKRVLRWPLVAVVSSLIGIELLLYLAVRWSVHLIEVAALINRRHSSLMSRLKEAQGP